MLVSILLVLISSTPAGPMKVATPVLRGVAISSEALEFYTEQLAHDLAMHGIRAVTPRDIAALVGLERQKQLLGCTEGSSCMAEMAGALGVEAIVVGDVARIGSIFQVSLKLISATDAQVIAMADERVDREEQVLDAIARGASRLADALKVRNGAPLARAEPFWLKRYAWVPLASGAVAAAAGGGLLWMAYDRHQQLTSATAPPLPFERAQVLAREGSLAQVGGWAAAGLGATALAIGVAGLAWPDAPAHVAIAFDGAGPSVCLTGVLP